MKQWRGAIIFGLVIFCLIMGAVMPSEAWWWPLRGGDGAFFSTRLRTSIVHESGSATATFSRPSVAWVRQPDGRLVKVLSGEARFESMNRTHNLLTWSTDFSNTTGWTASNMTASSSEATATSSNATLLHGSTAIENGTHWFAVELKRKTGTGAVQISEDGSRWTTVTLTADWQRFGVANYLAAGNVTPGLKIATSGDAVYIRNAQLEMTRGATLDLPTDFCSTNVLSAPYHGANVDGVCYREYWPHASVSVGNVVSDGTRTAISNAASGMMIEKVGTNSFLNSADMSTALPVSTPLVNANSSISPDGTYSMSLVLDDGIAVEGVYMNTTGWTAGAFLTCSAFVPVQTTAPAACPAIWTRTFGSGKTTQGSTGVINTVTGAITASLSLAGNVEPDDTQVFRFGNFWRVSVVQNAVNGNVAECYFLPAYNNDCGATASAAATGSNEVWGMQLESGPEMTGYINTGAAAVTRSADVLLYDGVPFTTYGTYNGTVAFTYMPKGYSLQAAIVDNIWSDGAINRGAYQRGSAAKRISFTSNTPTDFHGITAGSVYNVAEAWGDNTWSGALAGGGSFVVNSNFGTFDNALITGTNLIFVNTNGLIRDFRAYPNKRVAAQIANDVLRGR